MRSYRAEDVFYLLLYFDQHMFACIVTYLGHFNYFV